MKKKILQFRITAVAMMIGLLFGTAGKMYAYDFSAVCETGQTLYYNIIDATNHYVELTAPTYYGWGYVPPCGDIILPERVQYNSTNYTVTSIGDYAFYSYGDHIGTGLTGSLIIPNSVTNIGYMAFSGCSGFSGSLTIPNSVTSIASWAFENCSGFTGSLTIPKSVTSMRGSAFRNCSGLETIVVETGNPIYDSRENCNAVVLTSTNELVLGCKNTVILNSIASIGPYAFSGCSGLTGDLTIPNSITLIDLAAFRDCIGLTSINIPNTVTTIGSEALYGCLGLTSVVIPNSVISLGSSAFNSCGNLSSATIGKSITIVGNWVFEGCSSLTYVNILSEIPPTLGYGSYDIDFPTSNENFSICVPYESLNAYITATHWSNYSNYMLPLSYISIPGYTESNNNWQFIASPLVENTSPTTIDDMLPTAGTYDLYQFNQSATSEEWQNYKANSFNLTNGQGYLYANTEEVNLIFKGEFNEDETKEISLAYDANANIAGWNLVGNPFPVNAYANRSYYVMNDEGTAIVPVAVSASTAIAPCTGVMVKAESMGTTVTFNKAVQQRPNNGTLQIAVASSNTRGNVVQDQAIVSFNEGDQLGKFVFNKDNAKLYIPQGKDQYAIAFAGTTSEMPLNFEAHENGIYTLTVVPDRVDMDYLHLIDNLTGNDVNLLVEPSYSFEAKTTDYASRFKLVFSANEETEPSVSKETFAFVSNGDIHIIGAEDGAVLQIVDAAGRVLVCRDASHASAVSTTGMTPGVYILRLINGDYVRTQKIVVR